MSLKSYRVATENPIHELLENKARITEGLHCPSLAELFPESAPSPPALESPHAEPLSVHEQEVLLSSVEDALKQAELSSDTAIFDDVLSYLSKLWNCQSQYLIRATEALANGSRNPSFRLIYGQTGILNFFLRLIASKEATESSLILHSLRLIGNSCADTDENRAIVVKDNYTFAVLQQVLKPALIQVVIPVVYNLCVDYEPAQAQLAANKIVYIILKLAKDGGFEDNDSLIDYAYELIELVGEQEQGIENSPDGIISLLVSLTLDEEADLQTSQICCLTNCLAAYLNNDRFQNVCISNHMAADLLSVLRHSLSRDPATSSGEEAQALTQMRLKINQALAELSASPLFAEAYPLNCALSQTLKTWLSNTEDQLQICACIMLGNIARSDEVCEAMVRELKIHEELIAVLNSNARGAVLHAAIGFLKNLAIASDNRQCLGEAGIIPAIANLWGYEIVPQVQLSATSIARQLVISSVDNISRLLEPATLTARDSEVKDDDQKTYLSLLLALFEKSDSTPIKTEIGRIVASLCRTLVPKSKSNEESDGSVNSLLSCLFTQHEGIALPLGAMATQTQWPVVRSEAWFALTLMASTKAGAHAVVDCLQKIDGFVLIEQTLSAEGPSSDNENETETEKVQWRRDQGNIVVLVQELLRNDPDTLDASWRITFQVLTNNHVSKYLKQIE
ncbi:armadillo-type protein [Aspergillus californicus]